jgi:mannose-6-phosphate isomerase-like protein (cupin superfamily)
MTQEVLYVRSGRVRVDFYGDDERLRESREIRTGDVILLSAGGHGFEMLEDSELIEVKQGPYLDDKRRFTPDSEPR